MNKSDKNIILDLSDPKVIHIRVNLCDKVLADQYAYLVEFAFHYYEAVIENALNSNKIQKNSQVYNTYKNVLCSLMEQKDNLHDYNIEKVVADLEKQTRICDSQVTECDVILGKRNVTLEKQKSATYEQILCLDLKGAIRDLQGYLYDIQTDSVRQLTDYKKTMFPDPKINKRVTQSCHSERSE